MLFGEKRFISALQSEISKVEKNRSFTVVFASTIGSISKGIQRYTSDYDIRCLYRLNDTQAIDYHSESQIRYRQYNPTEPYNCIAFWEIRAFVNFLREPYIDGQATYKLFRNVLDSFLSPYKYDPYGLTEKIFPLVKMIVPLQHDLLYHQKSLSSLIAKYPENVPINQYINMLHSFLSIQWIIKYNEVPPMNILSLSSSASNEIKNQINRVLELFREHSSQAIDQYTLDIPEHLQVDYEDSISNLSENKTTFSLKDIHSESCDLVASIIEIIEYELSIIPVVKGVNSTSDMG